MMNKNKFIAMAAAVIGMLLMVTSCEDETKKESKMPVFDRVSVSPSEATPGDTIKGTLYFSYEGYYIKGTYLWDVSNSENGKIASGELVSGATKELSFNIPISEKAVAGAYTLTVKPRMMAAYIGNTLYLDYSSMGEVTTQLTITTEN